jgi:hypothetical protein
MAKVSYANLKLKTKEEIKEFDFNGSKIEVLQYLPLQDKIDLIDITCQKAREDRLYSPIKIDAYFHLHLVYLYTNLTFTEKQREDEYKLYDCLMSNGLIDGVLMNMNKKEYESLLDLLNQKIEDELKYNTTAAAILNQLITDLPKNAEAAKKIMDEFDPKKYQAVVDFAIAANGGRPVLPEA